MKRPYAIVKNRILINTALLYCDTLEKLLRSVLFEDIVCRYLRRLKSKTPRRYEELSLALGGDGDENGLLDKILTLLRMLSTNRAEELVTLSPAFASALERRCLLREFVEGLYDYWRHFERYLVLPAPSGTKAPQADLYHSQFVTINEELKMLILRLYRTVITNLTGESIRVYRQLPAATNLGVLTERIDWDIPSEDYHGLKEVPFIRYVLFEPPIIFYPRQNKRRGAFIELPENPLKGLKLSSEEWFCYPAKVGRLTIFIFFHRDFASLGFSLSNLFELADREAISGQRPEAVLVFGGPPVGREGISFFYEDKENDFVVGYVVGSEDADYFGYLKKTTLTLHNLIMIKRGSLPLHGAGVHIELKDGSAANLIIVGDSGAGKSETLEAFRVLAEDHLSEMIIIFDDMGSLALSRDDILCYGTEVGAFLRLDDLSPGFAFAEIDRSIFMNPHLTNARIVIPVAYYHQVVMGHPVDIFLYANNYEQVDRERPIIEFFPSPDEALGVFRSGARMAKGTTDEKGLVHSYFANPFGAPQRKEAHEILARQFFEAMFERQVKVGQVRTRLAIDGYEQDGPLAAAQAIFDLIRNL
ncbi:phosphoenolpyruvate carboxykinase [Thermosulfuriphilus ammonigenes]|uniref:Phosphoenolpyruvate carboxykinase n=1 Tax=Thermosulfuriphilus ammonigenes TaxID=1936021 RepID=A0A6G7PXW5_9BACT|nr:phosphoenolpyruvate carboxykinase [Thermosulfuriphilus ammonigenes]MBA2849352.1 hypothetical protein [Thermosulfuriphilus ammonigenes]QIJ72427.1 phosphoenolpyruvate carboxykinase [Thermosulfuriphilus ammonigenes]